MCTRLGLPGVWAPVVILAFWEKAVGEGKVVGEGNSTVEGYTAPIPCHLSQNQTSRPDSDSSKGRRKGRRQDSYQLLWWIMALSLQSWNMMPTQTTVYYPFRCCNQWLRKSGQSSAKESEGSGQVLDFLPGMNRKGHRYHEVASAHGTLKTDLMEKLMKQLFSKYLKVIVFFWLNLH